MPFWFIPDRQTVLVIARQFSAGARIPRVPVEESSLQKPTASQDGLILACCRERDIDISIVSSVNKVTFRGSDFFPDVPLRLGVANYNQMGRPFGAGNCLGTSNTKWIVWSLARGCR